MSLLVQPKMLTIMVLFTYCFEAVHFCVIFILKLHNKDLVIKLHILFVLNSFDLYIALFESSHLDAMIIHI